MTFLIVHALWSTQDYQARAVSHFFRHGLAFKRPDIQGSNADSIQSLTNASKFLARAVLKYQDMLRRAFHFGLSILAHCAEHAYGEQGTITKPCSLDTTAAAG